MEIRKDQEAAPRHTFSPRVSLELLLIPPNLHSLSGLAPEALAFVQSSLFDYFAREYVNGSAENGVVCTFFSPPHDLS